MSACGSAAEAIEGSRDVCRAMECAMGNLIADAMDKVGKEGVITVEEAKGIDTHLVGQQSRVEFAVAKHGYVVSRGGWFSDRSICYLASGRPVLVQDTGLGDWLPLVTTPMGSGSPTRATG